MANIERDQPDTNRTPTPRTQSRQSSFESIPAGAHSLPSSGGTIVVYIVTDVIYPTSSDFDLSKGVFNIDSVHSSRSNANARAKKIIYDGGQINGGQYKVDLDKIIEETKRGLFTGIGIGGKGDGRQKGCYARKCQVESKLVDEDSEEESEEGEGKGTREDLGDGDGDVQMG
jgi:Txe/YoeB family toxin of Txe-Axe toxin-antitoxin module